MGIWRTLLFVLILSDAILMATAADASKWPEGGRNDVQVGSCAFPKHTYMNDRTIHALNRIKHLIGRRYETTEYDHTGVRKPYKYGVGICTEGTDSILDNSQPRIDKETTPYSIAGALQWNRNRHDEAPNVLGVVNETEIMSGTDWISLTYEGGDHHKHKCNDEGRRSIIMIKCAEGEKKGKLTMIEENMNKTGDCFYLFELEHASVCPRSPFTLGVGSIIIIVFVGAVVLYLLVGFIIQRCCFKAIGAEQMPNFSFWQKFGHLQADGCDLLCRCGSNPSNPSRASYEDVSSQRGTPGTDVDVEKADEEMAIANTY